MLRMIKDLLRRSLFQQLSICHKEDAVSNLFCESHLMGYDHHGHALVGQFLHNIQNLTNLIELLEAEGLRDKFVVCCGGPRITHELAKELGYDAGFGAGKYADDVASFAVTEMVKRGMK